MIKKETKEQKQFIKNQERELYEIWKGMNEKDFDFDFNKVNRLDLSN
jgi:hypothetical protein